MTTSVRKHRPGAGAVAIISAVFVASLVAAQQQAPPQTPQQPSEIASRISGDSGAPPHYAVPDFIALRGDPSDKIPGARGIGTKRGAELLRQYGSLENMLADGRFAAEADALRLYRRIATMDRDAPLPPLQDVEPDWAAAAEHATSIGSSRVARRFEEALSWT